MNFFDMGFGEILLVIVVALIIWGPDRIPEIARNLGKTVRALRKTSFDLTTQIKRELELEETHLPPRAGAGEDKTTDRPQAVKNQEQSDTEPDRPEDPQNNQNEQ